MTEQLPPYTTLPQPEPESPQYTLPETFNIGRRSTQHLVRPDQLKAHLQLLAAFSHLKQQVVASESLVAGLESDSEKRWVWFVNMAVERFERWCWTIKQYDTVEQRLPPIDVTMVWHAYLLNPSWYAEDTARISKLIPLTHFTDYFPNLLANPDLLTTDAPRHERVSAWERLTKSPYDPFASAADLTHKSIKCPYCDRTILSPFLQSNGMGYAQSNFSVKCECAGLITKELLGLYKFAKNIVERTAPDKYLAGTLHTPLSTYDTRRGDTIKKRVLSSHIIFKKKNASNPVRQILINVRYDATRMRTVLNKHLKPRLLNKIMGAYTDDRVFSLDLVGAVLRQASFVEKMDNLGWTEPGYFVNEVDTVVLQHCTARYHAFLNIMAESPASFFVPTLDIDLAWHTHQLMASRYQNDCLSLVGRYVNHDDKVEEGQLATSFDITCRAWNDRYRVPYMHCGCPLPGDTIGQKLRRLLSSQTTSNVLLLPPKSDARAATHPSDHNAVFALHNMSASLRQRENRARKAEMRRLQAERNGRVVKRDGDVDHGIAFLYPVPMFYYYPGGCVAAAGAVVNGGLGCAAVSVVVFG
ncbi:uncharacterized protein BJ212DRAFT_1381845 [Suillus subaureus]|uniref:Uncharacterized protein n=1 Tax=Suillus subaureus TaxID=48587 RepID=A0A9P7E127_9AGAM|nr:uncharacterized protein BJ212DRAFT_1381845 [Suillus subaureus]KAG1808580.1 hypothetical protein BJ212DRAFT_1381845 [Suillus subaureus]